MKQRKLTPFDQGIVNLATEFSKIPDYENMMKDEDLKRLHTFIAVGMMGIQDAANMVVGSFIPAANKVVSNTRVQIQRSLFKEVLTGLDYDPNVIQHETIRLGYVFVFHKFEVVVNQLMEVMDGAIIEVPTPLKKYVKSNFDFNPTEWFRNNAMHVVNFISNCTKHQDGLCKLNNPAYRILVEFDQHSKDEKIIRSTQQFKADIKGLTEALGLLIHAITAIFLNRALETAAESLMEDTIDTLQKAQLESAKAIQESVVRLKISQYYR
ncbi:hypothetical protein AAFN85_31685 [Mucilaginibacter sp. CAU 1740]|uniref:hypothetical protein n=1 Tax=Mucilaginibacter sp. CAU 1740 TaxID=3140365 RepID=UPI00325B059F